MDIYENYVKEIQRYALLGAEEEKELSVLIQNGDKEALKKLVNCNLRLVVNIALKTRKNNDVPIMDMIQEGNLGLMSAAEKFSYKFNTRFSTYAYPWILQYIIRFVRNRNSMITIPQRKEEILRKITKINTKFQQKYGREASVSEIQKITGIPAAEIEKNMDYSYTFTSFEAEIGYDGENQLGDMIPDFRYNPESNFIQGESLAGVHNLLGELSTEEKIVIRNRFNFDNNEHTVTLRELSVILGVSAETVRQMEYRAIKKMRMSRFADINFFEIPA